MTSRKEKVKFATFYFLLLFTLFAVDIGYQVITNQCQPSIPFCTKR